MITAGDFTTPPSIMERTSRKMIMKETEDLNTILSGPNIHI